MIPFKKILTCCQSSRYFEVNESFLRVFILAHPVATVPSFIIILGCVKNCQNEFLLAFGVSVFQCYVVLSAARQGCLVVVFKPVKLLWAATLIGIN